jgi:hypothetical protein
MRKLVLILVLIFHISRSQIVIDANPASIDIYAEDTTTIVLDGNLNSINGASCIQSFVLAPDSPDNPSWVSNSGLSITIAFPPITELGFFELQYLVTETGTGSCTFIPHNRKIIVNVIKRPPVLNYDIPDYNNERAAVPFEIVFPQPLCIDPHGQSLSYDMLDQNDMALSSIFNFDESGNGRIYGTIPNSQAGTYYLRIYCFDSTFQRVTIDFTMYFAVNNNPYQAVSDLSPYAFEIPQGVNSTYILPTGIYIDPDGDIINYDF